MNVREVKRRFDNARISKGVPGIIDFFIDIKVKTKDGMYYTATTDCINDEKEKSRGAEVFAPSSEGLERLCICMAQQGVRYVLAQLSGVDHTGWWFEDKTIWLCKEEVGIIFADISLHYDNGFIIN